MLPQQRYFLPKKLINLPQSNLTNTANEEQLWTLAAEDDVLKSKSWRRSLILLKTMYPDPGTATVQKQTSTNLFNRLSSMRDNMEAVLHRNVEKLREHNADPTHLPGNIGKGNKNQTNHRNHSRGGGVIARTDKVRYGEFAKFAEIRREQ